MHAHICCTCSALEIKKSTLDLCACFATRIGEDRQAGYLHHRRPYTENLLHLSFHTVCSEWRFEDADVRPLSSEPTRCFRYCTVSHRDTFVSSDKEGLLLGKRS